MELTWKVCFNGVQLTPKNNIKLSFQKLYTFKEQTNIIMSGNEQLRDCCHIILHHSLLCHPLNLNATPYDFQKHKVLNKLMTQRLLKMDLLNRI